VDEAALAPVDRLLSQPERPTSSPADLDDDERHGRARVDRYEIDLVATDMDVPGEDRPASRDQPTGNQRLGGITRLLRRGSGPIVRLDGHEAILADRAHLAIDCRSTAPSSPIDRQLRGRKLQAVEVLEIERRIVGHDRQQLALEELVRRG
jgi:hypothetical protein